MATYSQSHTKRGPQKVKVMVTDLVNSVRFKKLLYTWTTVQELRKYIEKKSGIPPSKQKLLHRNFELKNKFAILEELEDDKEPKINLVLKLGAKYEVKEPYINVFSEGLKLTEFNQMVREIRFGFHSGLKPHPGKDGLSGNYFMRNQEKGYVGIFKPIDEESFAPNNPKGFQGPFGSKTFRNGIISGECAAREVAAYMLDNKHMHNVPETAFVEIKHENFISTNIEQLSIDGMESLIPFNKDDIKEGVKFGSLQVLKKNNGESGDFSSSLFTIDDVHAIAALDIRILNCDRNEANVLVNVTTDIITGKKSYKLIPIDHGLSLPDNLSICDWEMCWTMWPQIYKPFSDKMLRYISSLNPKRNIAKLRKRLKIREICLRNYRVSETLLIKGASKGLNIQEISKIIYKEEPEEKSTLEEIVAKAEIVYHTMKYLLSKPMLNRLNDIRNSASPSGKDPTQNLVSKTKKGVLLQPLNLINGFVEDSQSKSCTKSPFLLESNDILAFPKNISPKLKLQSRKRLFSVAVENEYEIAESSQLRLKPMLLELELKKLQSGQYNNEAEAPESNVKGEFDSDEENGDNNEADNAIPVLEDSDKEDANKSHTNKLNMNKKQDDTIADSIGSEQKLKRTISAPDLSVTRGGSDDSEDEGENQTKNRDNYLWGELFYYYVENFLDQALDKMNVINLKRERSHSYAD